MGIVYAIDQLDARAVDRVREFAASHAQVRLDEARALLGELGRDEPARFSNARSWEEVEEALDGARADAWTLVLLAASSLRTWELDKAIDRPAGGFLELFARAPSLAPVAALFRGGPVPEACKGSEALLQVAAAPEVNAARDAIVRWLDDGARAQIAALPPTLVGRVFGPRDYAKAWRDEEYLWGYWRELGEAVTTCADAGSLLAVTLG